MGLACIPRSPARRLPSDEPRHDVARGCSDQRADVLLPDQRWTLPITATVGRSPGSVGVAARWYLPVGDARIAQFTIGAPPELDGDAFVTNVLTLLRRSAAASSAASAASGRAFPPCDSSYRCPDHEMEDAGVAVSRPSRLFSATRRAPMRPS